MKQLAISNQDYREIDAISNSELKLINDNPGDFIWNKNAPEDKTKSVALDFGTALHTALLEPEKFNGNHTIYDQTKTRESVAFQKFIAERDNPNEIILFEHEYEKIRLIVDSAKAHPTFKHYLELCQDREKSILGDYMGVPCKIRVDLKDDATGTICELKSSADLSEWRESALWKNPLFKFDYGHAAAFYMDVYQELLGIPVNEYQFLVCQKSIKMGRYPVGVFSLSRDELTRYGFFERMQNNVLEYKERMKKGDWIYSEKFPLFNIPQSETLDISYD